MSVNLPVLDQGVGYSLIVGFGAFFAISMTSLSLLLARYKSQIQTSEMLMTANHSLKVGLIASAVVSSWTLAATLLSSTTGISTNTSSIGIANLDDRGIPIRRIRPLLVRSRLHDTNIPLRNRRHRAKTQGSTSPYIPRSRANSLWLPRPHSSHVLLAILPDFHQRESVSRWVYNIHHDDGDEQRGSLFPCSGVYHDIYYLWWD